MSGKIFQTLIVAFALCISTIGFAQRETSKAKVLDPSNMDLTVKPGDDFMEYAGGTWIKKNPVPPKETRWGSFTILRDFNVKAVKDILAEASKEKSAPEGSVKKRVGDFYVAGMDSLAAEKLGISPIEGDLKRAGAVSNVDDVMAEITYQRVNNVANPLFGFFVGQDRKHPTVYV